MKRVSSRIVTVAAVVLGGAGCAAAGRGPTQKVLVWSEPAGATVRVNGVERATTPAILSLPGGRHTIELSAPDFVPDSVFVSKPGLRCHGRRLASAMFPRPHAPWQPPPDPAAGSGEGVASCGPTPDVINLALAASDPTAPALPSTWQTVPVGTTVRLWRGPAPRPDVTGTVAALAGDTLIIESGRARNRHLVPASTVTSLEVGLRDRALGATAGTGLGALLGCVITGAIWTVTEGNFMAGGYGCLLVGTVFGAPVGALVGAAILPAYDWRSIPPPRR